MFSSVNYHAEPLFFFFIPVQTMNFMESVASFFPKYAPLILVVVFIVRYIVRAPRPNRLAANPASFYAIRTKPTPSEVNTISSVSISGDEKVDYRHIENDVFDLVSLSSETEEIMQSKELSYISPEEEGPERIPKMKDRSFNFELASITCSY